MQPYRWARWGDVNAFFGLMIDNVAVMGILLALVTTQAPPEEQARAGRFGFTTEFVLTHMLPGTAIGVLVGDLVYTWMAFRLARKTGKDVTAMPLGLDTPSTIGFSLFILVPALKIGWDHQPVSLPPAERHALAMEFAWHVGLITLIASGLFKLACAPFGNAVRRLVPRAGLLGSLAAIALGLIAFLPFLFHGIAGVPIAGMTSLLVILIALVAHRDLPGKVPGVLAAVLLGAGVYYVARLFDGAPTLPGAEARLQVDLAALDWLSGSRPGWWPDVLKAVANFLPIAFPFALATVVGGIDCTESAATVGDEYDTRSVLWAEGAASLIAGLLGGVIQTTPYIGHPAYKKMGGRAAYTLATALFIGAVGVTGAVSFLFAVLPEAALFPILVFVGLEITAASFLHTPRAHYPALAFAFLPALAALTAIVLGNTFGPIVPADPRGLGILQTLRCLANGFLISGLLWASALAMIIDGRLRAAAGFLLIGAACAFFGVIHSPLGQERIDLPWRVLASMEGSPFVEAVRYQTPYHWMAAYLMMAVTLFGLAAAEKRPPRPEEPAPPEEPARKAPTPHSDWPGGVTVPLGGGGA
jgi:AGZA family xanthine/uracil permease-like MFS transporter